MSQSQEWNDLPDELIRTVIEREPLIFWAPLREVSSVWRDAVDASTKRLTPLHLSASLCQRLSSLQSLSLERAAFHSIAEGTRSDLPSLQNLAACTNLRSLLLPFRTFSWSLASHSLTQLQISSLQYLTLTNLKGPLPYAAEALVQSPALKHLTLSNCDFEAMEFDGVLQLPGSLRVLTLRECTMLPLDTLEYLCGIKLQALVLHWCDGLDVEPAMLNLSRLSSLCSLEFWPSGVSSAPGRASRLDDTPFQQLAQMGALTHLSLNGMHQLDNDGLKHLSRLTNLHRLDVSDTHITRNGLDHLSVLSGLHDLQIAGCLITAPAVLQHVLSEHSHLTHLDISECRGSFSSTNLEDMLHVMAQMRSLVMNGCTASEPLDCLSKLQHLQHLDIGNGLGPGSSQLGWLSTLTELTSLGLQNSQHVDADVLRGIACMRNLRALDLSGSGHPYLPEEFSCLLPLTCLTWLQVSIAAFGYAPAGGVTHINADYQRTVQVQLEPLACLPLKVLRIWSGGCKYHPRVRAKGQQRPDVAAESVADRLPGHLQRAVVNGSLLHDLHGEAFLATECI